MDTSPPPLRFFFDYLSPYAYLAWSQLPALAARHGRALEPVPVLLAGLLGAHGQKGPAEIPPKRLYVLKDALRTAHVLGVPLAPPPTHPFSPLLALRVTGEAPPGEPRARLVTALFAATWGGGPGVTERDAVARAATEAGLDGAALVARADAPEAKARLRAETDAAIARGVFGVPTVLAGDEPFWGYDSLAHLERHLRGEDPVDAAVVERWRTIAASAARRT